MVKYDMTELLIQALIEAQSLTPEKQDQLANVILRRIELPVIKA